MEQVSKEGLRNTPARTAAHIQLVDVAELRPDPRNARLHSAKHVAQIAKSIEAFGFNVPLLLDGNANIIAGHGRLLAAKSLGWAAVPTICLNHLSPDQVKAYRIADNRLTDCSTWNDRLLAEQLKELSAADLDFDLESVGFDTPEIDLRVQGLDDVSEEVDESSDESVIEGPVASTPGDVWNLGPHRIICGSALEPGTYEALLGATQAAMVFSDPPYNCAISGHVSGNGAIQHREFLMASGEMSRAEFTAFLTQALCSMKRNVADGGLLFICMDWRGIRALTAAGDENALELKNLCVWDKGSGGMGSLYRSQHELVFVYKAGDAPHTNNIQLGKFGRNRTNVWTYPGVNSFARKTGEGNLLALHPTVKPASLVADALLDASPRGGVVLDPFLGSGTTIIAAEKTGRVGMGIELDPRYVDTAVRRWQRLTGRLAVHAATGQPFDEVARDRTASSDLRTDRGSSTAGGVA